MASNFVKESLPYMVVLFETLEDKELRKRLLLQKPEIIPALSELVLNLIQENVDLSQKDRRKLKRYKKELIHLVQKGQHKQKYRLLSGQKGAGLLGTVLSIGLPILSSLLFSRKRDGSNN